MKILNLYAGIGGNRERWDGHEITSVEYDPEIMGVYRSRFPDDTAVCGDALDFLQNHFREYDFIWASPPCPTHGQYRHNVGVLGKGFAPLVPEMTSLYGVIVFLQTYFKGLWVVENVRPYYTPLVQPEIELSRHLFWSNFPISHKEFAPSEIRTKNKISDFSGYEVVARSRINNKRQVLRNCVSGELGMHILECAIKHTEKTGEPEA